MNEREKLFETCKKKWGLDSQILMLAEEASELSVAALHLLRAVKDKAESYQKFAEEIGDVKLMIEEMEYYMPRLWRDACIKQAVKIERLKKLARARADQIQSEGEEQ